jgi:hypothetical protein
MATIRIHLQPIIKVEGSNPTKKHINECLGRDKRSTSRVNRVILLSLLLTELCETEPPIVQPPNKVPKHFLPYSYFPRQEEDVVFLTSVALQTGVVGAGLLCDITLQYTLKRQEIG